MTNSWAVIFEDEFEEEFQGMPEALQNEILAHAVLLKNYGPNGSGKTTFTPQMLEHDWADGCLFINPDDIAKNDFGDWNSPAAVMKAVVKAQELRDECLKRGQSMLIESVFSAPDKLVFIRQAKEAGFFIRFFFIGTDSDLKAHRSDTEAHHGGVYLVKES